jgi:hypothetical protein
MAAVKNLFTRASHLHYTLRFVLELIYCNIPAPGLKLPDVSLGWVVVAGIDGNGSGLDVFLD